MGQIGLISSSVCNSVTDLVVVEVQRLQPVDPPQSEHWELLDLVASQRERRQTVLEALEGVLVHGLDLVVVDVESGEGVEAAEEAGAQVLQLVVVQGQLVQAVHTYKSNPNIDRITAKFSKVKPHR